MGAAVRDEDGPLGGLAGREAEAGGVLDRDFAPLGIFVEVFVLGCGWNGRAMDDNFGPELEEVEVVMVDDDPTTVVDAFSSISVLSVSSSMGMVALGSIGSFSSRQSLSRSVI